MFTEPIVRSFDARFAGVREKVSRAVDQTRIVVAFEKRFDLALTFFVKHGTSAIDQCAAGFQQRPEPIQQVFLYCRKVAHVVCPTKPGYVRVPPYYSGGCAWGIEENSVEWPTVPPSCRLACVGYRDLRIQPQSGQVFSYSWGARWVNLQGMDDGVRSQFGQVGRLAAWRSTGVQNQGCLRVPQMISQQRRSELSRRILNREVPFL